MSSACRHGAERWLRCVTLLLDTPWVEQPAGRLRRRLGPPTEMTHVPGGCRGARVPDVSSDIGQVETLLGIQHVDRRRPAGMRPEPGWLQARRYSCRGNRLRDRLA